jgi:predicted aspartyl protease
MSTSCIEFPLSPVRRKSGVVPEPIIPLQIYTFEGIKGYDFLVDSGADITLLPRSLAGEIGVVLKQCAVSVTQGVEGRGMRIYLSQVKIQIGHWDMHIRCAFADHDRVPPLLGRLDVFSRCDITFSAKRHLVIFEKRATARGN